MTGGVQVPLLDNASIWKELQQISGAVAEIPEPVRKGQARAQSMAQARTASEQSVAPDRPADTDLLAAYMAYVKIEEVRRSHNM